MEIEVRDGSEVFPGSGKIFRVGLGGLVRIRTVRPMVAFHIDVTDKGVSLYIPSGITSLDHRPSLNEGEIENIPFSVDKEAGNE